MGALLVATMVFSGSIGYHLAYESVKNSIYKHVFKFKKKVKCKIACQIFYKFHNLSEATLFIWDFSYIKSCAAFE